MTTQASELIIRGSMVFDGVNEQLVEGNDVQIRDGKIANFEANPAVDAAVSVIDASGPDVDAGPHRRSLPLDAHVWPVSAFLNADLGYLSIAAAKTRG